VVEAMASDTGLSGVEPEKLSDTLKVLAPRWFAMRSVNRGLALLQSRKTMCWMRGPMTRGDLRKGLAGWSHE
jgi:hypothetical protein